VSLRRDGLCGMVLGGPATFGTRLAPRFADAGTTRSRSRSRHYRLSPALPHRVCPLLPPSRPHRRTPHPRWSRRHGLRASEVVSEAAECAAGHHRSLACPDARSRRQRGLHPGGNGFCRSIGNTAPPAGTCAARDTNARGAPRAPRWRYAGAARFFWKNAVSASNGMTSTRSYKSVWTAPGIIMSSFGSSAAA
jgi:hypothetical protein